jgi:hypothetical protein
MVRADAAERADTLAPTTLSQRLRIQASNGNLAEKHNESCAVKLRVFLLLTLLVASLPRALTAQSPSEAKDASDTLVNAPVPQAGQNYTYTRPSHVTMFDNYAFDAFGPYPILIAAGAAGISQGTNVPPEWGQGSEGYGRRFGSDYGIALIDTTTRYGLSEALKEDTLYYRCECTGVFPRLRHAVVSSLTARRGDDGHRVFSVPALIAPYVGPMVAVYGWYPERYGAKDAFRMGNYSLLTYIGGNISLEFLYGGPHTLLSHMHVNLPGPSGPASPSADAGTTP